MSIAAYNQDHSPLILTAVSSTATCIGIAVGGSHPLSASRCTQFHTALWDRSTPNSAESILSLEVDSQPDRGGRWRPSGHSSSSHGAVSFSVKIEAARFCGVHAKNRPPQWRERLDRFEFCGAGTDTTSADGTRYSTSSRWPFAFEYRSRI